LVKVIHNTFNYGYIGTRTTGTEPGDYLVVGPDWKGEVPAGIKAVFRSGTLFSGVFYRTQLFGPEDMPNVVKIQSGYQSMPLPWFRKLAFAIRSSPHAQMFSVPHQIYVQELDAGTSQ
jgi:hypothetical protein